MQKWLLYLFTLSLAIGSSPSAAQNLVYTQTAGIPVGRTPQFITANDFNGDSLLDVAAVHSTSDDAAILLGNGNGTFQSPLFFKVARIPMSIASGDVNGDSLMDLIIAGSGTGHIEIMKGRGDGLFDKVGDYPAGKGITFLALQDLNKDEALDIIAINSGRFGYYPPFSLTVLQNDGTGKFPTPVAYETDGHQGVFPTGVWAGDLTGDGFPDLAVSWSQQSWRTPNGFISLLANKGDGTFSLSQELNAGFLLSAITGADLDNDGNIDLITTSLFSDSVVVLLQNKPMQFLRLSHIHVGFSPVAVAVRDLDGDGHLDLAVTNRDSNSLSILLGNGAGAFRKAGHFGVGTTPSSLVAEDFDQDELPDLVTADSGSNALSVLLSGGGRVPLPHFNTEVLEFETNDHGKQASLKSLRLFNIGLGPFAISRITVSGPHAVSFDMVEDHCTGTTLKTGEFCTMRISFSPKTLGIYAAKITILDNANGSPQFVTLKGTSKG